MPHGQWSAKRVRQNGHIKDRLENQGRSEDFAEEIAARTVNKKRVQHGEARTSGKLSEEGILAPQRGGQHAPDGKDARSRGIQGRSRTHQAELEAMQRQRR